MKDKVMDVVKPVDSWERSYAKLEYLRAGINETFATKIDVMQHIKLCSCDLTEMWPLSAYPAQDFPYTCKRCLGGITREQNNNHNRISGFSGWDDLDDDREDMWNELEDE